MLLLVNLASNRTIFYQIVFIHREKNRSWFGIDQSFTAVFGWLSKSFNCVELKLFIQYIIAPLLARFVRHLKTDTLSSNVLRWVLRQKSLRNATRYLRLTLVLFFKSFLLVLKTFSFWQEGYAQGYHYMTFTRFPAVS